MAKMLSAKEVAQKLDTDARTLRKFLRSTDQVESPGKGKRYAIPANKVRSLKTGFDAWVDARRSEEEESDVEDEVPESPEGDEETESLESE